MNYTQIISSYILDINLQTNLPSIRDPVSDRLFSNIIFASKEIGNLHSQ